MKQACPRLIFITGTDTGVGKTLLTGLLLHHLRQTGCPALAMKPFCSGSRTDVELLHALQDGDLARDEINSFHFPEPVAPLVAARKQRRKISLPTVLAHIQKASQKLQSSNTPPLHHSIFPSLHHSTTPFLLIEGAGGLLSPLGERFHLLDIIKVLVGNIQHPTSSNPVPQAFPLPPGEGRLRGNYLSLTPSIHVIVVARNCLGTVNHTLLTACALQPLKLQGLKLVLMGPKRKDPSARSNPTILAELLPHCPIFSIPFLGKNPLQLEALKKSAKKIKKTLARILD